MRANIDPDFGDLADLRAKLMTWARGMTRGGSNAEDLVQTAFLRMLSNRHRAPAPEFLHPWAYVILRNEFLLIMRASRRQAAMVNIDDVQLVAPDNPELQTYCRQVFTTALNLDIGFLLAEPDCEASSQRVRRMRARRRLEARIAA